MRQYPHLEAIRPRALKMEAKKTNFLETLDKDLTTEQCVAEFAKLDKECKEFNKEVAEALYQDTKDVNSRHTIFQVYACKGYEANSLTTINSFVNQS